MTDRSPPVFVVVAFAAAILLVAGFGVYAVATH